MGELRQKFEALGNIKTVISACTFDESDNEYRSERIPEYSLGFVNGTWYAMQEQQSKIEQLEKEKAHLAEMNKRYLGKMQEQQDMVASVKDVIKKHDRYIPQSTINALEKALRGECE